MCDEEEETTIHLFLNYPYARAIWHGSILGLRTSELQCNSVEQWLSQCIISSRALEHNRMNYLLALFTTLWSIWNHRMVLHQGQIPNPVEVIIISQSLTCRYQEAFNQSQVQEIKSNPKQTKSLPHQNWQILIKVAVDRNRKVGRYGFSFEATTLEGSTLFKGGANSGRQSIYIATQEALVKSILKAKALGFCKILVLCNNKKLVQACNQTSNPSWQDQALLSDLYQLQKQSLIVCMFFVPRLVISHVLNLTTRVANYPGQFCYMDPSPI